MKVEDRILINRLQENVHVLWHRLTYGASPHVVEEALDDIRDTVAVISAQHPDLRPEKERCPQR